MYGKSTPILRIVSGCCARGERPRGGAAEQRNEFAPSHEHLPSRATMLGYTMSSGKHCAARQDRALTSELGQNRTTSFGLACPLPPRADIGQPEQSVGQAVTFCFSSWSP